MAQSVEQSFPIPNRVLVAEDDPDCLNFVLHFLKREGYETLGARDGSEALALLESGRPMLCLLDCEMPVLDGFSVCERIRATPAHADMPVVFLTGRSRPEDVSRGFAIGGSDYITKPIEPLELSARVRNQMALAMGRQSLLRRAALMEAVAADGAGRLELVRAGQESLLAKPEDHPDLRLCLEFRPADMAGGDFYDVVRLAEDEIGLIVADVSGHDLSIPYVTGALKALSAILLKEQISVSDSMVMFNEGLRRILSEGYYVTACYARVHLGSLGLDIVNAGHPPALLQPRSGASCFIDIVGDPLGLMDEVRFESRHMQLSPGDRLFLYSDGLLDGLGELAGGGEDRGGGLRGMARLRRELDGVRQRPLDVAGRSVLEEVEQSLFGMVNDDIALVGIEFDGRVGDASGVGGV